MFRVGKCLSTQNRAGNRRPSLNLNFQGGSLDSRVTFTRSTTGTFTGSNGLIQTAAINAPRFDYDPITLACKGLLIEEQRTNLTLNSATYVTAITGTTATTNNSAPDGTSIAYGFTEDTTNVERTTSVASFSVLQNNTISFYAKRSAGASTRYLAILATNIAAGGAFYNLTTGVAITNSSSAFTATMTNVGGSFWRCTLTRVDALTQDMSLFITNVNTPYSGSKAYTGDGITKFVVWGFQKEAGAFATSYIPTVASQVTRTADNASMTGTNFSSWYNQTQGTFATSFDNIGFTVGSTRILGVSDGTGNNRIRLIINTSTSLRSTINVSAVEQALLDSTITNVTTGTHKLSVAYALDSFAQSADAGTAATDNSGTIPTVNLLAIGQFEGTGGNYLNGHIQNISYYPRRLTNAELQAITA